MDRVPPPTMTSTPALKEGWLVKQGGHYRSWKKRWFVLKGNFLSYAKEKGKEPVGRITFNIIKGTEVASDYSRGKRVYFRVLVAESDRPGGAYLLGAETDDVMNSWIEAINEAWEKYKSKSEGISNVSLSSDSVGPAIQASPSGGAGAGAGAGAGTGTGTGAGTGAGAGAGAGGAAGVGAGVGAGAVADAAAGRGDTRESFPAKESSGGGKGAEPGVSLSTPASKLSEEAKKRRHSTQSASRLNRVLSQKAFSNSKVAKQEAGDVGQEVVDSEEQVLDEAEKARALYDAVVSGNRGAAVAWMQLGVDVNWANEEQGGRTALHAAMYKGDVMTTEELLKHGADPGTPDEEGMTPIHLAAHHGHKSCLDSVVAEDSEMIDRQDNANRTPIYLALTAGHTDIAKDLIRIAIKEEIGKWRKYHILSLEGDTEGLESLLADDNDDTNPLKPIAPADCDVTPIHLAAAGGHFDTLAFLLSKARGGANCITVLDCFKRAPLHFAVGSRDAAFVSRLVKIGAAVDLQDSYGKTALHFAAGLGQHDIAKILVTEHSAQYISDGNEFTPLHLACVHGRTEVVEFLLQRQVAQVNEIGSGALTPLFLAAHNGHSSCIDVLLRHDVDCNQQTEGGLTALHEAARRQNRTCLKMLLSAKCNTEVLDKNGETALFAATRSGSVECVARLLEAGASCQVKNSTGESLLSIASASGDVELVATFLDQGMDPSEEAAGTTPLTVAATAGLKYVTKVLLSSGADTSTVDAAGDTAVHHAVRNGHSDVLCELIDFGADIRHQNNQQATPLHVAAENDRRECLEVLLANGASANPKDANGATPLHLAAARGNVPCLQRLLLFGAKINSRNNSGLTPCNEAANHRKLKSTLLLVAHGASVDKETTETLKTAMKALAKKKKKTASKKARRKKVPHSVAVPLAPLSTGDSITSFPPIERPLAANSFGDKAEAAEQLTESEVEDETDVGDAAEENVGAEENIELEADDGAQEEEEEEEESPVQDSVRASDGATEPTKNAVNEHSAGGSHTAAALPPSIASVTAAAIPASIASTPVVPQGAGAPAAVADDSVGNKNTDDPSGGQEAGEEPSSVGDSDTTAGKPSSSAPQLSEQELARQYIAQAQKLLTKADYKAFHMLLREYKGKDLSVEVLFERLCTLFATTEQKTLLQGFVTFVPFASQAQYSKLVADHCA